MPQRSLAIGENLTALRKAAGLTQRQLAGRANVSLSLLSKVEVGDRAASHALTAAVARALGVPVERLQGQPYTTTVSPIALDPLRSSLRALNLRATAASSRDLERLRTDAALYARWRQAGRYAQLADHLPDLLLDLAGALDPDPGDRAVNSVLTDALYLAHGLAFRLGHGDLAESIEQRLLAAASRAGDPLAVGLARWTQANAFQAAGEYDQGLHLLAEAVTEVHENAENSTSTAVLVGSMHLRAMTLASRAGDRAATEQYLQQARRIATGMRQDEVRYHLSFGPTNTAIHEVAAAVELGDPERAIAVGTNLRPPRGLARTRLGHLHLDVARAYVAVADRPNALAALERARRVAPEQTRFHPMVAETTRVLISLHRRANPDLTRFTSWLGLVP